MSRGALYQLLQNRLYVGKVTHKDKVSRANTRALWRPPCSNAAQQLLAENRVERN